MRTIASAALVLSIGLIAAACGGDEKTPAPTEGATVAPATTIPDVTAPVATIPAATDTAGLEGTKAPVETSSAPTDATSSAAPAFAKKAAHTSEDDPDATYGLVSGRYRLAWDTPADDSADACERVEVAVAQQDGDFEYVRGSTSARFNATVNDLPQGIYKLEQRDPNCKIWQVRIDWMTN